MKLIRVLILFGNLLLIMVIAYLGYYFFLKEYFDPIQIVAEPLDTYFPKEAEKRIRDDSEYAALIDGFESQTPTVTIEPPPPPPPETDLEMLKNQLQIKGVVYNPQFPSRSGVHVLVSGIARYFQSGDGEKLSSRLDFVLADVKEITPDQEYIFVFQKSDGKIVEFSHKKSK